MDIGTEGIHGIYASSAAFPSCMSVGCRVFPFSAINRLTENGKTLALPPMKLIGPVTVEACQEHLRNQGTGVSLDLASMPQPSNGYAAFRSRLEDSDLDRIFLWFEFRKHTKYGSAKLTDALPGSASEERIRRFIDGDATKGWGPLDLQTASGFEPMLLTNDGERGPLYVIDGNHRLIAQLLAGKGFDGIPIYVCWHPRMLEWPYITDSARAWFRRKEANLPSV